MAGNGGRKMGNGSTKATTGLMQRQDGTGLMGDAGGYTDDGYRLDIMRTTDGGWKKVDSPMEDMGIRLCILSIGKKLRFDGQVMRFFSSLLSC